jgi:glyoxylase-like metal-dependent hydrolase (beta-lactamase superfamily II)
MTMGDPVDYGNGIFLVDADYLRPGLAAIHLIVEQGRAALIDTGTSHSLPGVLAALDSLGLPPAAVDYVILTHVHLDHAGGAGAMMRAFPGARLVVHPRGARHMIDPSKLIEGATAVYGADTIARVYPDILPVEAARVLEAPEGAEFPLAGRKLACFDAPGHAYHHICIRDASGGIFTGDVFGLSYRELDVEGRQFVFPTTTPTQFDPEAMHRTVERIVALAPRAVYQTHYGRFTDVAGGARDLLRRLDHLVALARAEPAAGEERQLHLQEAMTAYLIAEARRHGCTLPDSELARIWAMDMELNSQGLLYWLDKGKKA